MIKKTIKKTMDFYQSNQKIFIKFNSINNYK